MTVTITANISDGAVIASDVVTSQPINANIETGPTIIADIATGGIGPQGQAGVGVPVGGTTGQVLSKINGTNYNTQWTTVSGTGIVQTIVAGSNITVNSTDPANPIVSATGGGGGSGIIQSVTVTTGNVTAGSTALTNYIYLIAGAHTVTLPTAVGNTNLYELKNNHSANVSLAFTSGQTADGGGVTLAPQESVTLISNNTNWSII